MIGSNRVNVNSSNVSNSGYTVSRYTNQRFSQHNVLLLVLAIIVAFRAGVWLDVALAGNNAGAAFNVWPDTGQAKCYDNYGEIPCPAPDEPFYGQDAQYQGLKRSYAKLGQGGVELPDSATVADGWIMTRDNVTGLIWEIKTDDGGIHDKNNVYTWCDHDSSTNGGNEGTCGNGTDTEDFINALNLYNFGGYSDWRLPTIKELSTLVNSNIPSPYPTIDIEYFPNTLSSSYWSSTTGAIHLYSAWDVDFRTGHSSIDVIGRSKDYYYKYVRAVRAGQDSLLDHLVDNHDGTITDTATGLMWQKCSMGQVYNASTNGCDGSASTYIWKEALAECENLELAGHDDWRLPNRNELQSIVDYSRSKPSTITTYFPNTVLSGYWSSTTLVDHPAFAWHVNFKRGDVANYNKYDYDYVRAVRAGQSSSFGNLELGDVSGDGQITIVDALLVARYAVGLSVAKFNADAADVDCNSQINIVDALLIAIKSAGLPVPTWCGSGT